MKKVDIKKEINIAVNAYKRTLEMTYLEKSQPFYGAGIHKFTDMFTGKVNMTRKKNGNLHISGDLSKDMFTKECTGLPMKFSDWAIFPAVFTWFNEDVVENKDNAK